MSKISNSVPLNAEDRREDVVRATCAVIARQGLDKASMRAIARELGCTTGVLTHYFRDKNALLSFVLEAIISEMELERFDPAASKLNLTSIRQILKQYLPVDEARADWWKVWLSFTVAAMSGGRAAERHRQFYSRMKMMWTAFFESMQKRGQLASGLDPAMEADCILCLADGVGVQALISPKAMNAARQIAVIDAYISKLSPKARS